MTKIKVSIIGFGRFGKTLLRLLKDDFSVETFDKPVPTNAFKNKVIFFCVPISQFDSVIKANRRHFRSDHLLIDVLSVKLHSQKVFNKYLRGTKTQALLTHPMFGPDSSKNGFAGLPIILDQFRASGQNYNFWKKFFQKKRLRVVEITARQHDQLAARSQGLTHFLGRLLAANKMDPTTIDSLGAKKLLEVIDLTCHDSWQLFRDLQTFNPYTKIVRFNLEKSFDRLAKQLLPKRVDPKQVVFGIQGGVGSFNEQAITHHIAANKISNAKVKFLYTSARVLQKLHAGQIDFGLFAIHNSVGGIVGESVQAMAKFKFKIVKEFSIPIQHFLMKLPETPPSRITTIMAHPQVFAQCQATLKRKFSKFRLVSGQGDLIDTAKAAQALAAGKLPKTTAILGPKRLAEIHGLEIIATNLQDDKTNNTAFLLVSR